MKEINDIARRIAELREACGYTQERLAEELGIELRMYKDYEKTGENIPINVIYSIATKFGVDFNEILTGAPARLDTYHIVRRGEGKDVDRYEGYKFEDLAFRYVGKIMQPLLVTLDVGSEPAEAVTHSGQEFNLILEGEIQFVFDDKKFILKAGDSVFFNPKHPHAQHNVGTTKARFLTVIAE